MKKKFKMDVDCANCAAKIEAAIAKLEGVNEVSVNFMTQKITIDADEERFEEIMQSAVACCRKVDADSTIYLD